MSDVSVQEFEAALRQERRAARDAVSCLVAACVSGDISAFIQGFRQVEMTGSAAAAFRAIARLKPLKPKFRRQVLEMQIDNGDTLRSLVNDDFILIDALRVLLPPYRGQGEKLFRGDSFFNRRHRTYGLSWSSRQEVGEDFAQGMRRTFEGGSVVLQTDAPREAIICAPAQVNDRYQEREFLVDRRQLRNVSVIARFQQISVDHWKETRL